MMRLTRPLFLGFLVLFFGFSASAIAEMSADKVARKTKLSKDESKGVLDFKGPDINALKHDPYYVRSFMGTEYGLVVHFIIVEYDFLKAKGSGDSSIFRNAADLYKDFYITEDLEGNTFETKVFHRDFDGCGSNSFCEFEEYFRIEVDDEYFRAHQDSGITLYAKSRAGPYYEIKIYPAYVQGLLKRLEKERIKRGIN